MCRTVSPPWLIRFLIQPFPQQPQGRRSAAYLSAHRGLNVHGLRSTVSHGVVSVVRSKTPHPALTLAESAFTHAYIQIESIRLHALPPSPACRLPPGAQPLLPPASVAMRASVVTRKWAAQYRRQCYTTEIRLEIRCPLDMSRGQRISTRISTDSCSAVYCGWTATTRTRYL